MGTLDQMRVKVGNMLRTNKFRIKIVFPPQIAGTDLTDDCEFFVKSATFPGKEQGTVEVFHQGESIKLAGDNTYSDWTCTIYTENDMKYHKAFMRWMEYKRSSVLGTAANDLTYKTAVTVEILDGAGGVLRTCVLVGAHPISVSEIQFDQESKDEVVMFDCTFAYDYDLKDMV